MAEDFPLLLFPKRVPLDERSDAYGGPDKVVSRPTPERQGLRLTPKFTQLYESIEAERVTVSDTAPDHDPEFVLVLETIGSQDKFYKAAARLQADWLFEFASEFQQDEDFHLEEDGADPTELLKGRMYLVGTNQRALEELLSLWWRYQEDPAARFDQGLAPLKHVFAHLHDIRRWNVQDRIDEDMRLYWHDEVVSGRDATRFELEAWYFNSTTKNTAVDREVETFIAASGGRVLKKALIPEIAYHGFLVELPTRVVASILDGIYPSFVLSDRVMFFRPRAQSVCSGSEPEESQRLLETPGEVGGDPIVALLDGLPLANHLLLNRRLIIDDPDDWAGDYAAKDRVHGTAMASLIVHGDLNAPSAPPTRPVYVRPILRPDPRDTQYRRAECTPDDQLLIDLVHRAVRRLFERDGDTPAVAPTVKVINLSVGNEYRIFSDDISPWARLVDWLSFKYDVLFVISAGNQPSDLRLEVRRDALRTLTPADQHKAALVALLGTSTQRRLMSPAEAINAITVGAHHSDASQPQIPASRHDLFPISGLSPISRVGMGMGRSIKPDILMPGGRLLFREHLQSPPEHTIIQTAQTALAPGQLVARPSSGTGPVAETEYSRGTSNATALATRTAAKAYEVIDGLRARGAAIPESHDAVLIKALLVHGAHWGPLSQSVLDHGPSFARIGNGSTRAMRERDFIASWLGYGPVDDERALTCAAHRATLIGVGEVGRDRAVAFSAPMPVGLGRIMTPRRMTITLAWMSPTRNAMQRYRQAKLWITPPADFGTSRENSPHFQTVLRGTVQHEVWEGSRTALPIVEGQMFECKVNCMEEAPGLNEQIKFAICMSLEVAVESGIDVYSEIRDRIAAAQPVRA